MQFKNIFTTRSFVERAKQKAQEEGWHPLRASRELMKETALKYALYYGAYVGLLIILLVLLSFTEVLRGPFVLAQIILFLVVGTILLAAIGIWWLWRKIKQKVTDLYTREKPEAREGTVIDGHLSETDKSN